MRIAVFSLSMTSIWKIIFTLLQYKEHPPTPTPTYTLTHKHTSFKLTDQISFLLPFVSLLHVSLLLEKRNFHYLIFFFKCVCFVSLLLEKRNFHYLNKILKMCVLYCLIKITVLCNILCVLIFSTTFYFVLSVWYWHVCSKAHTFLLPFRIHKPLSELKPIKTTGDHALKATTSRQVMTLKLFFCEWAAQMVVYFHHDNIFY